MAARGIKFGRKPIPPPPDPATFCCIVCGDTRGPWWSRLCGAHATDDMKRPTEVAADDQPEPKTREARHEPRDLFDL